MVDSLNPWADLQCNTTVLVNGKPVLNAQNSELDFQSQLNGIWEYNPIVRPDFLIHW